MRLHERLCTDGGQNDGDGADSTGPDDTDVTPERTITPPTARIHIDSSSITAGDTITLDGSSSEDPDGRITKYNWKIEKGSDSLISGSGRTFSTTLPEPGTYTVSLTVEDNHGIQDIDSQSVTARSPAGGGDGGTDDGTDDGDTGDGGDDDSNRSDDGKPSRTLVVDGTGSGGASYDFTVSGELEKASGTLEGIDVSANPGDTVHGNEANGQVFGGADGYRFSGSLQKQSFPPKSEAKVYVDGTRLRGGGEGDGSGNLTARISAQCQDLSCNLSGSDSSSPSGNIVSYTWELGDGTTERGKSTTHTYDSGGGYTVTLTIEGENGHTDSTTKTVVVRNPSGDADALLSIAALVPTEITQESGEWVPAKKRSQQSNEKVWEIAPAGEHWKDTGGSPPSWLQGYETRAGRHYLKIPCLLVVSTSIDTANTDDQIPWDPEIEVTNSNYLLGQVGDGKSTPGVHRRELIFEVPQTSAAYLNHIGNLKLTLSYGTDSQFYDELATGGLVESNEVRSQTHVQYGLEYTHSAALGDALQTAYTRLSRLQTITSFAYGSVTSILASGATITMSLVAKESGKQAVKEAVKLGAMRVVKEGANQYIEDPTRSQISPADLEKARCIQGTALLTTEQNGESLGLSGPMIVVRSE